MTDLAEWLTIGGDRRIVCDPARGVNAYGCPPTPQPDVLAYGSVTASTISPAAFSAAQHLLQRLPQPVSASVYAHELERMRGELITLCGLGGVPKPDIIFAASGTDLHLLFAQLASSDIIMTEASETGSGVPAALSGRHFSSCTALGEIVTAGDAIPNGKVVNIHTVPSRAANGAPRAIASIDAEVEALAEKTARAGQDVLLMITDVSKTGLLAPSPDCAFRIKQRFPDKVQVLVDACQFRLAPATLRAYLEHGFSVAVTGSKFIGGPAFSGALFVPDMVAQQLRARALPPALGAYSARADWPQDWAAASALPDVANAGLLLRWEAALAELRAFHALPEAGITAFTETFAKAIQARLIDDPAFAPLATPALHRHPVTTIKSWDTFPTVFSFLLHRRDGTWINRDDMKLIYERLRTQRCQVGQPVMCGVRDGISVSALRLALSARLIVDAVSKEGRGADTIIAEALSVLDIISGSV